MSLAAAVRPALGWATMGLYGFGAVANQVKLRGLATFLMVFYNQVMGLPAATVGLAASIALIFDAFVDPTIGQISDNTRTRWGRRHPFMYAAAVPVSIAFLLLWNPPEGLEGMQILAYLLACLLTIRLFDTFFELPSQALLPELTEDYHKRTVIFSLRVFFGSTGGLIMYLLALTVFMKEGEGRGGMLERDGYFAYSLTAAIVIFTAIMVSTLATHRFIPWLRAAPTRRVTLSNQAREMVHTVKNHAFMVTTLSGMFTALAGACKGQLDLYFGLFFWGFNQKQLGALAIATVAATFVGAFLAPLIARRLGKKAGAITAYSIALAIGVTPILLRLVDVMPANGTPLLFWIIIVETFLNASFAVATGVLLQAMIADIVEDAEVRTGRRSEGLLFSADNLFKKISSAGGPVLAGVMLTLVAFPANARKSGVEPEVLRNLALVYLPIVGSLYGVAILCLFLYRITKQSHEENLRKLAAAAAEAVGEGDEEGPLPAPAPGAV